MTLLLHCTYATYKDDIFLLFRQKYHAPLSLTYLNIKHSSIKFPSDPETNDSLAFLYVHVERVNNRFTINSFRMCTFSGIGISFFSHGLNILFNRSPKYYVTGATVNTLKRAQKGEIIVLISHFLMIFCSSCK